ncbi:hypothetical protein Ddye_028480 [Dipteronia dyeriana]|uniref:Reverse transcriptase n=1 Tax=Dipteronia dyeriana TaxID=168575 RepID=A0AAD9TR33_9ROSI|nr:hypothetical protein Ddye_028480 [Dipteronia dyeriana]
MRVFLDTNFMVDEVRPAIFDMHPTKAPGLDGLPALFYQKHWHIVGENVTKACLGVLNDGQRLEHINGMLITLIPKSAFIFGRLVSNNAIVGFECMNALIRKKIGKGGYLALKLDMFKAYDRVEWSFLEEGFSRMIFSTEKRGEIGRFRCSMVEPKITHLFFYDDSLLFYRTKEKDCHTFQRILDIYARASGHVVNFHKSTVCVSKMVSHSRAVSLARNLGVQLVGCHERYLGLPSFVGKNKKQLFANIRDRIWERIKGRQSRLFSVGGKEVPLKAVVQAIPTYTMSLFMLPKSLVSDIHKLCANFWWGSCDIKRGIHWGSWRKLCRSKEAGGLGFRDLSIFNQELLAKQSRVLKDCYFPDTSLFEAGYRIKDSFLWKSFCWSLELLLRGSRWRIGNGSMVSVYKDHWLPRPSTFRLFSPLTLSINAKSDTLMWHFDKLGSCSVKSGYHLGCNLMDIQSSSGLASSESWWKFLWRIRIPTKIKLFIWRASFDWIPTRFNLAKRRMEVETNCPICGKFMETTTHALWNCSALKLIRSSYHSFSGFGVEDNMPFFDLMLLCKNKMLVEEFLIWNIWWCRNNVVHGRHGLPDVDVVPWAKAFLDKYGTTNVDQVGVWTVAKFGLPRWVPLAYGKVKMNTDAAIDNVGRKVGIGIILRDCDGNVLAVCSQKIMAGFSLQVAEAVALLKGLVLARDIGIWPGEVEMDAQSVVKLLSSSNVRCSEVGLVITDIKLQLFLMPACIISFTPRETNKVAHHLAKLGLLTEEVSAWLEDCPPSVVPFVLGDCPV